MLRHYTEPWGHDFLNRLASSLEITGVDDTKADEETRGRSDVIAADFDDGSEEARGDGELQHELQHHDGHQQHDGVCQRVHGSFYIGDAVDNGTQTMHSGENAVILCGPEGVIDEIA